MDSRIDQHQEDDLEALSERLRSLRITKKKTPQTKQQKQRPLTKYQQHQQYKINRQLY